MSLLATLGLTVDEAKSYLLTLATAYELKVTVQILTNEHAIVSTVTHILLDGQVDGTAAYVKDNEVEVSRTCNLQFLDPTRTMTFDSDSPADGALFLDRMVRVIYSVRCPSRWVDVPVFTGPVTKVDRDGDMVTVEAQGKEIFGLSDAFTTGPFSGTKVAVARSLLTRMGEVAKYISIPASSEKMPGVIKLARDTKIWIKLKLLIASQNRLLHYDARGVAQSVETPTKPCVVIQGGNGGMLTSDPQISYSIDGLINIVEVIGAKPSISAVAPAPKTSPLSAWKIGRNGKPRYKLLTEENSAFRTDAQCLKRANTLLKAALVQQVNVTYDCAPIPHLEPWDIATLKTARFNLNHRIESFSLPLRQSGGAGTPMTIGYQKNLAAPRRIVRAA